MRVMRVLQVFEGFEGKYLKFYAYVNDFALLMIIGLSILHTYEYILVRVQIVLLIRVHYTVHVYNMYVI